MKLGLDIISAKNRLSYSRIDEKTTEQQRSIVTETVKLKVRDRVWGKVNVVILYYIFIRLQ